MRVRMKMIIHLLNNHLLNKNKLHHVNPLKSNQKSLKQCQEEEDPLLKSYSFLTESKQRDWPKICKEKHLHHEPNLLKSQLFFKHQSKKQSIAIAILGILASLICFKEQTSISEESNILPIPHLIQHQSNIIKIKIPIWKKKTNNWKEILRRRSWSLLCSGPVVAPQNHMLKNHLSSKRDLKKENLLRNGS